MSNAPSDEQLVTALLGKPSAEQRRALAKAITLLESTRLDHRARADQLLNTILPHTGQSFRLGISGVPGVGKSTLIENLGLYLISKGHRVAVLAIDPSSSLSGGSILGDKTRMELLSVNENAFIRPSPSSGTLGGVAERTREVMLLAEAAGHDVVIVETVGVGQSEIAVAGMTDLETERTADLLLRLKGKHCLIVVEHDMSFINTISDIVTVLCDGSVLAQGKLAQVQADLQRLQADQ